MALCAPYDKTGIDQVQAERLSMSWIERIKSNITPTRKASIPEGVWTKCDSCGQVLYRAELERNLEVCPKCDHHMRMSARNRLHSLLDEGSLVELGSELEPKDVLKFRDSKKYKDRLASAQKETGEKDALVVMKGTLYAMPVIAAAFEFSFMGGSMGSVVGARFVRAVEQALDIASMGENCNQRYDHGNDPNRRIHGKKQRKANAIGKAAENRTYRNILRGCKHHGKNHQQDHKEDDTRAEWHAQRIYEEYLHVAGQRRQARYNTP